VTDYSYRYYDPATGRWPSRDPIGEAGGINLYSFIANEAVSSFDVLGLFPYFNPGQNPAGSCCTVKESESPCRLHLDLSFVDPNEGVSDFWASRIAAQYGQVSSALTPGTVFDAMPDVLPRFPEVADEQAYWNVLKQSIDEKLGKCCISGITIRGHGNSSSAGSIYSNLITNPNSPSSRFLEYLAGKKCAPLAGENNSAIDLKVCSTAEGAEGKEFLQILAKRTSFDVLGWTDLFEGTPHGDQYKATPDGGVNYVQSKGESFGKKKASK